MVKPIFKHAKRILRYLKGSANVKLVYGKDKDSSTKLYCDADFGADSNDRKSTSGMLITMFGDSIHWSTKKQAIVTLSSAESEYIALSDGVKEILWFKNLVADLGVNVSEPIRVFEDNQSTISMVKNPNLTKRSKHIDLRFHFIKDVLSQGIICIEYIQSNEQKADIFTKSLGKAKFKYLSKLLNLDFD